MIQNICKKIIPYLLFLAAGIFFLLMSDESRIPVTVDAINMEKSAGYEDGTAIGLTPDSQFSGKMLSAPDYLLDAGSYRLGVAYRTDHEGDTFTVYDNGREIETFDLHADATYQEFPVTLEKSSLAFTYEINYGGSSSLLIQSVTLIPEGRFYRDTDFLIVLLIILTALFALWRFLSTNSARIRKDYTLLTLLGIGLFACLPYLNTGLNWAIDLCYHLIRIEGIKDALLAGQFPVILYPEAMQGNGYLNTMYPNLFLYIPALLRLQGISLADSFKFLIFICNFATAFLTYHCAKTIGGSQKAALLASLLYTCCPYRFTNIYARGAVGEFLAMTFFPLVFAGLYHILIGNRKKWGYLTLGMVGLLHCHILSVTLGGIFCALFCVLYIKELLMQKRILQLGAAAGMSLLLGIGFLVPFLDFYKNEDLWMDALAFGSFEEYSLNLSGLFGLQTTGDYYVLTLGIPLAVCFIVSLAYLLFEHKEEKNPCRRLQEGYLYALFLLGAFLTFMMLSFFPGWEMMTLPSLKLVLEKIQFAWRLLGPVSLLFALTGSILLFRSRMLQKYSRILFVALAGICLLSATRFKDGDFAYASDAVYTLGHESKLIGIPKGKNTVVYPFEWRLRHTIDADIVTKPQLSEDAKISDAAYAREGFTSTLSYTCNSSGQYIELPVTYYKGYQALDEANKPVLLENGYNNRIRIPLADDGITHTVTVRYVLPASYIIATWISLLTATLWLLAPGIRKLLLIRKENAHVR